MGDLKVEGKVSEWCSKCKHCISYDTIVTNGICKITTYTCEDPYDGLTRELDAEDDICCSMFEIKHDMPYDKMSRLEHELEMDRLRMKIHQLEKEKAAHMKGIERLKGSNNDLKESYNHLLETFKRENEQRKKVMDNQDKMIQDLKKERDELAEKLKNTDISKVPKLEDKVEKYEKILIDILNETYKHPQLFEHNILAYKLIPGHIRFLRNSFDTMCDKYDPVFEENTKLKEEIERLKGSNNDLKEAYNHLLKTFKKENESGSKIVEENVKLENEKTELIKASKRKDDLIRSLRNENKTRDDEIMRLQWRNDNQSRMIQDLKKERDELKNELDKYKESDDIYFTTTQVNAMVKSMKKENGEIKALKDQIGYLERENEMIKEMNSNQFKSIEKLKSEKAKLEKELEVALNKTTALLGSIHSRNEDIERLNTELVTKKKEYKDTINALKSQKKYLEERMAIMKDDIKYLKERYDAEDD